MSAMELLGVMQCNYQSELMLINTRRHSLPNSITDIDVTLPVSNVIKSLDSQQTFENVTNRQWNCFNKQRITNSRKELSN